MITAKLKATAGSMPRGVTMLTTAKWYVPAPPGSEGTADVKNVAATRIVAMVSGEISMPRPRATTQPATPMRNQCPSVPKKEAQSRPGLSCSRLTATVSRWKKRIRLATGIASSPRATTTKTSKLTLKGLLDDLDDFKATFELGLDLDPRNDDPKNNDPNKLDPDDPNFYDLTQPVLRVRVLALRDPDLDLADPNLDPNGPNVTRFEKVFTLGECGKRKDDPLDPNQFLLLLNCKSETVPRARAKFRTAKGNDFFPRRFKFAFQARDVPSSLVDPNSIHYGVVVTTGPIDRAVLIFCEEPKKLRSGELNLKCRGPSP